MSATPTGLEAYLDAEEKDSAKFQSPTLKHVVRRVFAERGLLALGIVFILLSTAATLAEPWLFGLAIDKAIVPKNLELLHQLAIVYLGIVMVRVAATIAHAYTFELLGGRVMYGLRMKLFSHLHRLPVAIYDKHPVGRIVTRVTNDIASMSDMFSSGFVTMIANALTVAGILVWLAVLNLKLALISSVVLPPMVVASVYFSRKLRIAYRNARGKLSALNAFLAENILGMKVVHLFNRQALHLKRFRQVNQWYADAQIGSVRVFAYFQPTITLAQGAAMAQLVYHGARMTSAGELQLGTLVAFFSYVLSIFQPMREIADKWNVFLSGMASAERIFSILDWKPELDGEIEARVDPLPGIKGEIVFENVWFAYSAEHWVLRDFSLTIPAGSKLGVVGHTGAGKTTIISLLMRFYEPQKGRILLDGKDLREYDKRALRATLGIVQQDVFLFSGSVEENVTLWREPRFSEMGILDEESRRLGLDERGSNLSVGQRQVVAFSRVRESDPSVWILDEATANIDSNTEAMLERELERASGGKTRILIAHRLATVKDADQIVVLHKGQKVESGKHSDLVRQGGLYARLYKYQSAAAPAGE